MDKEVAVRQALREALCVVMSELVELGGNVTKNVQERIQEEMSGRLGPLLKQNVDVYITVNTKEDIPGIFDIKMTAQENTDFLV